MFPVERRKAILDLLDKHSSVSVEELSKTLYTGEATIRRDLDKMAREGVITRTHGGAVRLQSENIDYPYAFRENENARVKDELAVCAAELVNDGQTMFLDGSSTVIRLIGKIAFKKRLKIITNGVKTAFELSQAGLDTKYNVDLFFLSCRALSIERGISESSEEVAEVKAAMAERSRKNVLLVDSAKFDKTAFCTLDIMKKINYVITDKMIDGKWKEFFDSYGIKSLTV